MTARTSESEARRPDNQSPGRRALLTAAAELLSERGYQDTSVADIAVRAGISIGSVYNIASSKSALFIEVYREYDERQSERVRDAVAVARGAGVTDHASLFLAGTHGYLVGAWRERELGSILVTIDSRDVDLQELRSMQYAWSERNARSLGLDDDSPESQARSAAITGAIGGWVRGVQLHADEAEAFAYIEASISVLRRILEATTGEVSA